MFVRFYFHLFLLRGERVGGREIEQLEAVEVTFLNCLETDWLLAVCEGQSCWMQSTDVPPTGTIQK